MLGELLTTWTIRLALACYVAAVAGWLVAPRRAAWPAANRWAWTVGCGLAVLHVACAFHFFHGWSHAAAYESTADETDKVVGLRFGAGLFFNYAFILLWLADVVWMWGGPVASGQRWSWPRLVIHAYLFFIAVNGAIVFENGPTRWAGLPACLVLAGLAAQMAIRSRLGRSLALPTSDL